MLNATPKYNFIEIKGPTSVVSVTPEDAKGEQFDIYLLMGPTGSGKSAFIECLSTDQKLDISKDSLDSVTQEVVCYRVVNLTRWGRSILLVDTPGFLDTKLSESRITKMITETLHRVCQSATGDSVRILYFQPITDIRMGGSKRDAVKLLRAFAESFKATAIAVVTTMWNHISSPKKMEDANHRFSHLQNEIFVRSDTPPIEVIKFEFSRDSVLSIMEMHHHGWLHHKDKSQNTDPQYQFLICNNLLERISNVRQQLLTLAEDKQNATTPGREDPLLLEVVLRDERVALGALQSFLDDLRSFLDDIYEIDSQSCSSPFPRQDVTQSQSPSPPLSLSPLRPQPSSPSNKKSLSARLTTMASSMKKVFKKP